MDPTQGLAIIASALTQTRLRRIIPLPVGEGTRVKVYLENRFVRLSQYPMGEPKDHGTLTEQSRLLMEK